MKTLQTSLVTTALVGLLAGTAAQASAQESTQVTAEALQNERSVAVNIADLNLNSPQGQDALYNRIARAADQVCGARNTRAAGSLTQARRNRACYKEAVSRAMSDINASAVVVVN